MSASIAGATTEDYWLTNHRFAVTNWFGRGAYSVHQPQITLLRDVATGGEVLIARGRDLRGGDQYLLSWTRGSEVVTVTASALDAWWQLVLPSRAELGTRLLQASPIGKSAPIAIENGDLLVVSPSAGPPGRQVFQR